MLPTRRRFFRDSGFSVAAMLGLSAAGCVPQSERGIEPELVWGRRGFSDGRFQCPRAMVISPTDELFIVDKLGRIQVYDVDGKYRRGWRTPFIAQGKPTGLGWGNDGELLVADTHYFRVLFYDIDGNLDESRTIGGEFGDDPGQFHFVTDVAQDIKGHFFVGQYGQIDQIQEFDPDGQYIRRWGSQGRNLGEFSRPQALLFDSEGLLWVADACNHRIQIFDVSGAEPELVKHWGEPGPNPGQLKTPYGIDFDQDGSVFVAEYGNNRIQKFSKDGESMGCWGTPGKEPGQFLSPWALILDSNRKVHVLDSLNHRVQRFDLS